MINLRNYRLKVYTYNFQYLSWCDDHTLLPGIDLINGNCRSQCIEAHNNVVKVAKFIKNILQHDLQNPNYISSINCIERNGEGREWKNAQWMLDLNPQQAIFGQCLSNNQLRSLATSIDIVAHEFFHGVTAQKVPQLKYLEQSGALEESYSDIFAILVANFDEPDINQWQWEIGRGFGQNGNAIRNLQAPQECNDHPAHMDDYNDQNSIHTNCGIHNKAAYNLLTSQGENGQYLFDARSGAILFYRALFDLPETSDFLDSRSKITKAAKGLFRGDPQIQEKLGAIAQAFKDVGIS